MRTITAKGAAKGVARFWLDSFLFAWKAASAKEQPVGRQRIFERRIIENSYLSACYCPGRQRAAV